MAYSKYGNIKETIHGFTFDSRKEAKRYLELCALVRVGEIRELELQPKFEFRHNGKFLFKYIADFSYISNIDGQKHIEDVKGTRTAVFNLKKKIIEAIYGIKIELV